jgi:hypothetical protein
MSLWDRELMKESGTFQVMIGDPWPVYEQHRAKTLNIRLIVSQMLKTLK